MIQFNRPPLRHNVTQAVWVTQWLWKQRDGNSDRKVSHNTNEALKTKTYRRYFQSIADTLHRWQIVIVDEHSGGSKKINGTNKMKNNGTLKTLFFYLLMKFTFKKKSLSHSQWQHELRENKSSGKSPIDDSSRHTFSSSPSSCRIWRNCFTGFFHGSQSSSFVISMTGGWGKSWNLLLVVIFTAFDLSSSVV